jgi:hypothetical protein
MPIVTKIYIYSGTRAFLSRLPGLVAQLMTSNSHLWRWQEFMYSLSYKLSLPHNKISEVIGNIEDFFLDFQCLFKNLNFVFLYLKR